MLKCVIKPGSTSTVVIDYIDAQGDVTEREIKPIWLAGNLSKGVFNATYIEAFCKVAKGHRTFRINRIKGLSDPKTGEILDLLPWLRGLDITEPVAMDSTADISHESTSTIEVIRYKFRWRLIILMIILSYFIGRWRIIRWVLRALHQQWGLWL